MEQVHVTINDFIAMKQAPEKVNPDKFIKVPAVFSTEANVLTGYIFMRRSERNKEMTEEAASKLPSSKYRVVTVLNEDGKHVRKFYHHEMASCLVSEEMRNYAGRVFYPETFTPKKITNLAFSIVQDSTIPKAGYFEKSLSLLSVIPGAPKYFVPHPGGQDDYDLIAYIFPIMAIDGMSAAYDIYTEFPDDGVVVSGENRAEGLATLSRFLLSQGVKTKIVKVQVKTTDGKEGVKDDLETDMPGAKPMTQAEWFALAYTHIFSWCKTRSTAAGADTKNFELAVRRRLGTMKQVLGLKYLDETKFLQTRVEFDALAKSYQHFNYYPGLKSTILTNLLNLPGAFAGHLKMILRESQLTVFNMIHTFLYDADLTVLHFNSEIIAEVPKYITVFETIQTMYGRNWPYLKLVNPNEQMTALNQFPHLANAARAFLLVNSPSTKTLRNIAGMKTIPLRYVKQAKVYLNADHYSHAKTLDFDACVALYKDHLKKVIKTDKLDRETMMKMIEDADKGAIDQDLIDFFNAK